MPKTIIPDNLKAAVLQADMFDPELNSRLASSARHYSTVHLPTKPRTPQHKDKIEAGVKFTLNNALKGRSFARLGEHNLLLEQREMSVIVKQIHGSVLQQAHALFESQKRAAGPAGRFVSEFPRGPAPGSPGRLCGA